MPSYIEKSLSNNYVNSNVLVNDVVIWNDSNSARLHLTGLSNASSNSTCCIDGSNLLVSGILSAKTASFPAATLCNLNVVNLRTGGTRTARLMTQRASVTQGVLSGVKSSIVFNTADIGNNSGNVGLTYSGGAFTNSSGSNLILLVNYQLAWDTQSGGYKSSFLCTNSNYATHCYAYCTSYSSGNSVYNCGSATLYLTPSEYFTLTAFQNSGGARITGGGYLATSGYTTRIQIYRLN